ncbi:hypothetical protein Lw1_gp254 [Escherichia phage Lw1]|uniref:Uncharacterized protein n=1 Tax=Escherichia phage Lw1 TaxID=1307804 RepID=M9UY22_9CAUD|nr:hypothetical protein Lw1_gp254 [Escherichia phage Lw1]AGJ71660.1 hypothetical protein Lw1_gp254 [Escherichia phage Lw1]
MKIKNTATENLCNEIAVTYWKEGHAKAMKDFQHWKEGHAKAMKDFQPWCDTQKLAKWEYIVIVERIKELILEKKGTIK